MRARRSPREVLHAVRRVNAVPVLDGARYLLALGAVSGGTRHNLDAVAPYVELGRTSESERLLLADAQTSGGLLLSVPPQRSAALVADLIASGATAAVVGRFTDGGDGTISIH